MKICIPTETKDGMHANVYGHFGSAPYFTVYDTGNNSVKIIDNKNSHHTHGMCQPMDALDGYDINAVVCGGMGIRAISKLNERGIRAFKAEAVTVEEIIEKFKKGALTEITVDTACTDHGCP